MRDKFTAIDFSFDGGGWQNGAHLLAIQHRDQHRQSIDFDSGNYAESLLAGRSIQNLPEP